jgi:hypothetical protein
MKMKTNAGKRAACLIAAAALVLGGIAPGAPVFAAETDGLEAAILLAKSLADVPEEMEDFNYYISEYNERGYAIYSLNWSGDEVGTINAEVANGRLVSLNRYIQSEERQGGLGSVSREAALGTARDFLAAVDPALAAKMALAEDTRVADLSRHSFNFIMRENGVPVDFVTARVDVDKFTGEVTSYFWNGVAEPPVLPEGKAAISEEEAKAAFLDADGVRLEYRAWYDRESK